MSFSSPILIVFAATVMYALPGLFAVLRGRRRQWAILALNILLGWTFVGWVAAACWALSPQKPRAEKAGRPVKAYPPIRPPRHDRFANDNAVAMAQRSQYLWDDKSVQPGLDDYATWLDSGAALSELETPTRRATGNHSHAA